MSVYLAGAFIDKNGSTVPGAFIFSSLGHGLSCTLFHNGLIGTVRYNTSLISIWNVTPVPNIYVCCIWILLPVSSPSPGLALGINLQVIVYPRFSLPFWIIKNKTENLLTKKQETRESMQSKIYDGTTVTLLLATKAQRHGSKRRIRFANFGPK